MRAFPSLAVSILIATRAGTIAAQASPYIALDDPRLPALEHLISLGGVDDPSPLIRPFRRMDAFRMLDSAVARGQLRDSVLVADLRAAWSEDTAGARWEVEGQPGIQATFGLGRQGRL